MTEGSAASPRTAALYLVGLILIGGLLVAAGSYGQHVATDNHWHATLFDTEKDAGPTRLQLAVESSREIRTALATPLPPQQPLHPITAKLARGHLVPGYRAAHAARTPAAGEKVHKLPKAALHAMASAKPERPAPVPAPPPVDIHQVY